jgi:hypothetical protein
MPCDLSGMEIQILYILYRNKNFRTDAGYHSEKLKKILRKKYDQDFYLDSSRKRDEERRRTLQRSSTKPSRT